MPITSTELEKLGKTVGDDDAIPQQKLKKQRLLQGAHISLRRVKPAASGYNLATLVAQVLPDNQPAAVIERTTAHAGTTTGEYASQAFGATPTTGQVAVAPNGDIVFLGTDAPDKVDITYTPEVCDVVELVLAVTGNSLAIPAALTARGVILIREVESLAGTLTGKLIVLTPSASAPATGQARLNVAKTAVAFASADAVTKARVKLAVVAADYS